MIKIGLAACLLVLVAAILMLALFLCGKHLAAHKHKKTDASAWNWELNEDPAPSYSLNLLEFLTLDSPSFRADVQSIIHDRD